MGSYAVSRDFRESPSVARAGLADLLARLDWATFLPLAAMLLAGCWILQGAVEGVPGLAPLAARQWGFLAIALAALAGAWLADYRWLNRAAALLYLFNLGALVVVLFAAPAIKGARSWLDLGPFNWQPSETMKIATVLVCAQWLALRPERIGGWSGITVPGAICGVPALLILAQPDLGTASIFFAIFLAMMLMAGTPRRHLALLLFAAALGAASAYPFLKPYQKARIHVFLDPEADPKGRGYNVIQSKIAVGNGGVWGRGWGKGTQGTHRFLPEHHTDFIFASAVEQLGLAGGLALLAGFGVLGARMLRTMAIARDRFGGLVAAGLLAIFASHVFMNVGMNMGMLPVTGIPLPLMSYGGSFLVSTCLMFGLVLNVASRRYVFAGE